MIDFGLEVRYLVTTQFNNQSLSFDLIPTNLKGNYKHCPSSYAWFKFLYLTYTTLDAISGRLNLIYFYSVRL